MADSPTVYLALSGTNQWAKEVYRQSFIRNPRWPTRAAIGVASAVPVPESQLLRPPLLVSYHYSDYFVAEQQRISYRHWILDSGAFSAHQLGARIELHDYISFAKDRLAADSTLKEVFALDVIGDWRAGLRNAERMWTAGVPAIPCYHVGEPEDVLVGLARDYPKIALGGMAKLKGAIKRRFVDQCFARIWPKPVHGFGVGTADLLLAAPWHSVDATNWEAGPTQFGTWRAFGGRDLRVRGSRYDLRVEVEWFMELERTARRRWAKEMVVLDDMLKKAGRVPA